jgi:hypothetical protein
MPPIFQMASVKRYVLGANDGAPDDIDPDAHQPADNLGACVGFCHTWLAAFIHNDPQATNIANFEAYMCGFLRYQANYLHSNLRASSQPGTAERPFYNDPETSSLLMDLLHLTKPAFQSRLRTRQNTTAPTVEDFESTFVPIFAQRGPFATMVGFCRHVIAIARRGNTLYIFDPNFGLAHYVNTDHFCFDMMELINLYFNRSRSQHRKVQIWDMRMTPAASII